MSLSREFAQSLLFARLWKRNLLNWCKPPNKVRQKLWDSDCISLFDIAVPPPALRLSKDPAWRTSLPSHKQLQSGRNSSQVKSSQVKSSRVESSQAKP